LVNLHAALIAGHQLSEHSKVWIAVGAVGQDDDLVLKPREHPVEGVNRCSAITERRVAFDDLFYLRRLVDLNALPVTGQTFQEVISLDITVVIGSGNVGWVQIDEVNVGGTAGKDVALP